MELTSKHYWNTDKEKQFIINLGSSMERNTTPYAELLRRYKTAFLKRVNFGSIDRDSVLKFLDERIRIYS